MQVNLFYSINMPKGTRTRRRSGCPLNASVEMLGDRWSLLIIRDLMVRGYRTFKDFQGSSEKIATNILADRLKKLEAAGIVHAEPETTDRRRVNYRLTEKGIDLAPVLLDLLIWAARHEETGNQALVREMQNDKERLLATIRQRWAEGRHQSP